MGRHDEGRRELAEYRRLEAEAETRNRRLEEIEAIVAEGRAMLLNDRYEEAASLYRKGIDSHPDAASLYRHLGMAESWLGRHRAAIETYRAILDRGLGEDAELHAGIAREYEMLAIPRPAGDIGQYRSGSAKPNRDRHRQTETTVISNRERGEAFSDVIPRFQPNNRHDRPRLYRRDGVGRTKPPVRFVNVTAESGIDFTRRNGATSDKFLPETMGSGALAFD